MLAALDWIQECLGTGAAREPAWSTLDQWWTGYRQLGETFAQPIDRAIVGAFSSDRLAFAFSSGHQSALRRLLPDLDTHKVAALCITEAGGAHPRAIETGLTPDGDGFRISGEKRYTTLLPLADLLLVAAKRGERPDGRPDLCVALVDASSEGVSKHAMPDTPFCPEIPHGITKFDAVQVEASAVLPGDGYTDVIKAFRTVEDLHVVAGVAGYLARVAADNDWPEAITEELFALLAGVAMLDAQPPGSPATHLGVAGCFGYLQRILGDLEPLWADRTVEATSARWRRDQAVLTVASKVRQRRRERAWGR